MGKSTISMVIFNSYVSLPEGMLHCFQHFLGLSPAQNLGTWTETDTLLIVRYFSGNLIYVHSNISKNIINKNISNNNINNNIINNINNNINDNNNSINTDNINNNMYIYNII